MVLFPDFKTVKLSKPVSGEELEQACLVAAQELGLKARQKDRYETKYTLGSLREDQTYRDTSVRIGGVIPLFSVEGIRKGEENRQFFISRGIPIYFASKRKVEEYLERVSARI